MSYRLLSFFLIIIATGVMLGSTPIVYAATTFYFEAATSSVVVGSAFPVKLLIDSDEPVNAYAFTVNFSPSALRLFDTNNANSLITVWRGDPKASQTGTVLVRGGSISPFKGQGGELL